EIPILVFRFAERWLRRHVDGLVLYFRLALGRTDFHTKLAARAIFGRHLQRVLHLLKILPARGSRFERRGGAFQIARIIHLGANHSVWTDQHAFAALNTKLLVPYRDFERDIALFPLCSGCRKSAVEWHRADRQIVALAGDDPGGELLYELGSGCRHGRADGE